MTLYSNPVVHEDTRRVAALVDSRVLEQLAGSRVLITGANGLIGGYLCCVLLAVNDLHSIDVEVVANVRNLQTANRRFADVRARGDFELLAHDVLDPLDGVSELDLVIHGASQTAPGHFNEDPVGTLQVNIRGTENLLEFIRDQGHGRLVLLSTREVYGHQVDGPRFISESDFGAVDPTDPRSCYPEGKRAAEALVTAYGAQHGVEGRVVRISHTYGPGMRLRDGRVIGDFVGDAVDTGEIVMKSDGTAELALTYITDCIAGILVASLPGEELAYNVSDDRICTVGEFGQLLAGLVDGRVVARPPDPAHQKGYLEQRPAFLASDRARGLGWRPRVSLEEGVAHTLSYFKESSQ